MECIEILKHEHRTARLVIAAGRRVVDACGDEGLTPAVAGQFLDFFSYFGARCHGPKEEGLLYARLHRRGLAWDGYPLRGILREHTVLRVARVATVDWLSRWEQGSATAFEPFLHDLQLYLRLQERHIDDEEAIAYPLAREWLTGGDLAELAERCAAIAANALAEGTRARYADMAHGLIAGAGALTARPTALSSSNRLRSTSGDAVTEAELWPLESGQRPWRRCG